MTNSVAALGLEPEQFWATLPAQPKCMFVPTPAELHKHPNRWTWTRLLRSVLASAERAFGVRLVEDVVPVGPPSAIYAGMRGAVMPYPVTAVYSSYDERPLGQLPQELVTLVDVDDDGVAEYAHIHDLYPFVVAAAELFGLEPPREVILTVDYNDSYYNPVPVIGRFGVHDGMVITLHAAMLVDPAATVGQRAPLNPADALASLSVTGVWYSELQREFSAAVVPADATHARVGIWLDDVAKAVAALYPTDLCIECFADVFGAYRVDLLTAKLTMLPQPQHLVLGYRRGLVEFANAVINSCVGGTRDAAHTS